MSPRWSQSNHLIPTVPFEHCIAKTTDERQPGLSVKDHCLYVGEVANALLRRLPLPVRHFLPDEAPALIALHDLGKVSPGFQKRLLDKVMDRARQEALAPGLSKLDPAQFEHNHAVISESTLRSWGKTHRKNMDEWTLWGEVLGNHHGERQQNLLPDGRDKYGGQSWKQERHKLLEVLVDHFGPPPEIVPSIEQTHILSGLTCVADWIGSDERFFSPQGLPPEADIPSISETALDQCGWVYPKLREGLSFQEIFGFSPNPMQIALIERAKQPGLYILEAPMGLGKTEAALYAAYQLMQTGHNSGLYFALPTRLTSNRICQRVNQFLGEIVEGQEQARLVHGQAWLHDFLQVGGEELRSGRAWFHPAKRALLLPFGVGTVDQALLGVLCVRHYFLRIFGLAGKVVILDEIHSYDMYTGTLLDELVRVLRRVGCTVIILSATLTHQRRAQLLEEGEAAINTGYPSLTIREYGKNIQVVAVEPPPTKKVTLAIVSTDTLSIAQEAVERARAGQCVLWIANTVKASQEYYRLAMNERREGEFPIGLLHARFPLYRREELEKKWMADLGKDSDRPPGCILIATQVVEQSVDIDADFLISELAPTDMLLQRLGRLWRHDRPQRPCDQPVMWILAPELDQAQDQKSFKEMMGDSAKVYAPYVLWRSYQVWRQRTLIAIPGDIRAVLEDTYIDHAPADPAWVAVLYRELEQRRTKLKDIALGMTVQNLPSLKDDEQVSTRYSTQEYVQTLLIGRQPLSKGSEADLVLLDGSQVKVKAEQRHFLTTAALHKNVVQLPRYRLKEVNTSSPSYLQSHFWGDVAVLRLQEDSRLVGPDEQLVSLGYDHYKGIYYIDGPRHTQSREDTYESDW